MTKKQRKAIAWGGLLVWGCAGGTIIAFHNVEAILCLFMLAWVVIGLIGAELFERGKA